MALQQNCSQYKKYFISLSASINISARKKWIAYGVAGTVCFIFLIALIVVASDTEAQRASPQETKGSDVLRSTPLIDG